MNEAAAALTTARNEIVKIQKEMAERYVKLAAAIDKLHCKMPPDETREFLVNRCGVPAQDIASLARFSRRLGGFEKMLVERRLPLTVMKSLASASTTVRGVALARIASGARFDATDLKAIRREIADAKTSPQQQAIDARRRALHRLARNNAAKVVEEFEVGAAQLINRIAEIPSDGDKAKLENQASCVRSDAERLLPVFEQAFGSIHARPGTPAYRRARPYELVAGETHALLTALAGSGRPDRLARTLTGGRSLFLRRFSRIAGDFRFSSMVVQPAMPEILPELPQKRLTALELCAGAGGMALGLEAAGYDHLGLIELDNDAVATLRRNRPHWPVFQEDLTKIDFNQYAGKVDLLCGGLPCQAYSEEGLGRGKNDDRDLLLEGARAVREIRPRAFLFENVRGVLFGKHADQIAAFLKELGDAGYEVQIVEVNTQDYGVAQNRPRIMFVGMDRRHRRYFEMPGAFPKRRANVGDVLYDLMAANGWSEVQQWAEYCRTVTFQLQDGTIVQGAQASTVTGRSGKAREKAALRWAKNGLNPGGIPDEAPSDSYAQMHGGDKFVPGITLKMRARLQDFPENFEFIGSKDSVAQQIGNAVAPRMAQAMGLAIYQALEGCRFDIESMLWPPKQAPRTRISVEPPPIYVAAPIPETALA
jgi:DNA (cytosine-5)-methyltransferase 1